MFLLCVPQFVRQGGYDTHSTLNPTLASNFADINKGLSSFVKEMKAHGRWDDIVIVSASEFGRTMTSNGKGTDHGCAPHARLHTPLCIRALHAAAQLLTTRELAL